MRRLALALVPTMLLACSEEPLTARQAAVKLVVDFDFNAGCIEVQALDTEGAGKSELTAVVTLNRDPSDRKATIAVFRGDDWSNTLRLIATAHEPNPGDSSSGCLGQEVARNQEDVTLDEPGAVERRVSLSATDGDGDAFVARSETGGGTDCDDTSSVRFPGNPEVCDDLDNNCDVNQAVDEGLIGEWYRDADNDGALDQATRVVQCGAPAEGYVQRTNQLFDCDDRDAERTPGKAELCDNKDNDCNDRTDEGFPRGHTCTNGICSGTRVCSEDKLGTVCNAPAPVSYYPDVDGDGQGAVGAAGTQTCTTPPVGTAISATDCDDVDRAARAGLAEVCNAVDNDCDGQVDEGLSCGGTLARVVDPALGNTNHDWLTVSVRPSGLPVWIAGFNGKLVVRNSVGGAFQNHSFGESTTHCGDVDWYASWVRPSDGHVFLAGDGGRVAEHTGTACINQADAAGSGNVYGMVGFESGGVTTLYFGTTEGRLFTWVPGSNPVERDNAGFVYVGIHALSPDLLLVAGSTDSLSPVQRAFSYANGNLGTEIEHTLSHTAVSGYMNAVWMGAANLAYAVGNEGWMWKWDGARGWERLPRPPNLTANLYSVVTLPNGDAYTVDSSLTGQLHRRTPYGWALGPKLPSAEANKPLNDIAMSSERDFWVVGQDGLVFHYPEPPRP